MIKQLSSHPFFNDKTIASCELLDHQGYCNSNYLVIADKQKYIVRKFLREEIDRMFEYQVHCLASQEGITSSPMLLDADAGIMISSFLDGIHKIKLESHEIVLFASTLKILHSIKINNEPIELHIQEQTVEIKEAFQTIANYDKEFVLCHNDLNPKNILFASDVKLIDWEYAGVNDRYFDLASVCVEFDLKPSEEEMFLDIYFEGDDYKLPKLEAFKVIYQKLCEVWFSTL